MSANKQQPTWCNEVPSFLLVTVAANETPEFFSLDVLMPQPWL